MTACFYLFVSKNGLKNAKRLPLSPITPNLKNKFLFFFVQFYDFRYFLNIRFGDDRLPSLPETQKSKNRFFGTYFAFAIFWDFGAVDRLGNMC